MMMVRIEADGEPCGTKVLADDGRDLTGKVTSIKFVHAAGEMPYVELQLVFIPAIVKGVAVMLGPDGKRVRKIEYEDGTVDRYDGVIDVTGMEGTRKFAKVQKE